MILKVTSDVSLELQDESDRAFANAARAQAAGRDPSAFDDEGIAKELGAGQLQSGQGAWSLAKQGLVNTLTLQPTRSGEAWANVGGELNPLTPLTNLKNLGGELAGSYANLGAQDFSSSASVLLHRVSTIGGLTTVAIGDAGGAGGA